MAYTTFTVAPRDLTYTEAPAGKAAKRGLWRRLFDAMIASRQRQADREIACYLQSVGGKFTDATEREIARRFPSTRSFW
jgi:hypothetical protein